MMWSLKQKVAKDVNIRNRMTPAGKYSIVVMLTYWLKRVDCKFMVVKPADRLRNGLARFITGGPFYNGLGSRIGS